MAWGGNGATSWPGSPRICAWVGPAPLHGRCGWRGGAEQRALISGGLPWRQWRRSEGADGSRRGVFEGDLGNRCRCDHHRTWVLVVGFGLGARGDDRSDDRGFEGGHRASGVEEPLQCGDGGLESGTLVIDVTLEDLHIGHQLVADALQLVDLGKDAVACLIARSTDLILGVGQLALVAGRILAADPLRLLLGSGDDALCVLLGLGNGGVSRALREQERATKRVVHLAGDGGGGCRLFCQPSLGRLRALRHLTKAQLELADGHTDSLEEVIDLIGVVPAELLLAEVDVFQELRRDIHPASVPNAFQRHGDRSVPRPR